MKKLIYFTYLALLLVILLACQKEQIIPQSTKAPLPDTEAITVVKLKPGSTCLDVDNFIKNLEIRPAVKFALPVFDPLPGQGGIFEWVGLTNEFIVTLPNAKAYPHLKRLARLTRTTIVT